MSEIKGPFVTIEKMDSEPVTGVVPDLPKEGVYLTLKLSTGQTVYYLMGALHAIEAGEKLAKDAQKSLAPWVD